GRGIGDQRVDIRDLLLSGAVRFHGIDQRIELGELARDPHVIFGVDLAKQLRLERGVVRQQNIKFGLGEHRHGDVSNCEVDVVRTERLYNGSLSDSANSVSFCRIETLPAGASSSGAIIASALLASSSRIIALTGPCAVADSDSDR